MLDARNRGSDPFRFRILLGVPGRAFRNGYENDVQNADYHNAGQCRQKRSSNLVVHGRPPATMPQLRPAPLLRLFAGVPADNLWAGGQSARRSGGEASPERSLGPPEGMRIVVIRSWMNFGMLPAATVEKLVPAREQPAPTSV
jgi:hypothetical protein